MSSSLRLENSILYARKLFYPSVVAGFLVTVLLLSVMSVDTRAVFAQIPAIPSLPTEEDEDDTTADTDNQQSPVTDSLTSTSNASNITPPTIEITSLQDGQEVPVGELTIEGISSDDEKSDCRVYADVNDITPLQNATAAGGSGGEDDYSLWTFAYTEDYQLIAEGANELTAKLSCFDGDIPTPVSEWHSINVTGVITGAATTTEEPTEQTTAELTADEETTSTEEEETAPDTDNG